ncbi:MAG: DUF1828 domain-containing protein [Caldilineaceae bacterium SB0661_bin_32]|uniref:DUF1828 domain-containing protein n=1 Tax=Caldilineaceae bacterium SB0661_bin_32 TaxID=2605255 RepID=A0A6B1D808_9CHLR|nr:DUF1828 domain-containing protein [Caldilineaceae bacterium SB0661_bin_32]
MTIDSDALRSLLCERLCEDVRVDARPDGDLMLRTHFEFPDGDRYPIHLSEAASGGLRLSDRGHTLMHISYEHDIDSLMDGTRGMLLERIMGETGLSWDGDGGAFCLDTPPERLPEALFTFGQALTRVYDLTLLSHTNVGSTFYDDLADLLSSRIDEAKIERDYLPPVPNAQAYPVDYRIEGKSGDPLFLYGVPNRDKARLTTIMLSYFHRHDLRFESILVFADQTEIPRMDLARLSDVGGGMISSPAAHEDLNRKLLQRAA